MKARNPHVSPEMRRGYHYSSRCVSFVRPQEGEIEGRVVKLSWLAHHFSHINIDEGNVEQLQRFTRAWILRFIGGILFVNKTSSRVSLKYLQFLRDFEQCSTYTWGPSVLAYLYREMCSAIDYKVKSIGGMCILIQMWACERCMTLAPKRTPPVIENKPLGHRWLRRGNQHIDNDDLRLFRRKLDLMKRHEFVWEPYTPTVMQHNLDCNNLFPGVLRNRRIHGITLKGKQDENWFHLLAPMISQWNNRAEFRVDVYPRQEGLLGYNSDYMVWYRRKTKMFVDPNNANTAALGDVVETLQYMVSPQGRNTWTVDDLVPYLDKLAIISEEQERITEPVSHGPASEREFPAQEFHILQSSVETRGIGRRRELQHDAPMATPNALFAPQWNVPGAIPDMGDLLGVDLRQEFSAEAEQAEAGRQRGRRNPDRQARR
ncbi:Serine/threonine-protein phosphatase 7 long form [Glycine max]|nr:Serine/threonine-protein phosphatase 7 long form [Glycine max]